MHLQPNRNYTSNDDVQTPLALARAIVAHFQPRGRILEPCCGDGHFLRALRECARSRSGTAQLLDEGYPLSGIRSARAPWAFQKFGNRHSTIGIATPSRVAWCESKRGRDFFAWRKPVDWIVTNPPWSQFRPFLGHAMTVADHVVLLVTINHLWTRARIRDMTTSGFGLREILMVDTPATFPPLGFQLGAIYLARGWKGAVTLTDARESEPGSSLVGASLATPGGRDWWGTRRDRGETDQGKASTSGAPTHRRVHGWSVAEIAAFRRYQTGKAPRGPSLS